MLPFRCSLLLLLSSPRRARVADSLPLARVLLLHLRLVLVAAVRVAAPVVAVRAAVAAAVVVGVVVPRLLLQQRPLRVGLMERSG